MNKKVIIRIISIIVLCISLKALFYDLPKMEWYETLEEAYEAEAKEELALKSWNELNLIFFDDEKKAVVYAGHDADIFTYLVFMKKEEDKQKYYKVIERYILKIEKGSQIEANFITKWMEDSVKKDQICT